MPNTVGAEPSPAGASARQRVGLALGSGSARGLAHIGVLRAIEAAGIAVDCVAGASMGALIGAVYAAGKLDGLETTFQSFDWKKTLSFFDFVLPKSGLIDGAKVAALVREHVGSARIEDLSVRFAAVATDITRGEEVVLDRGDVIDAVRASVAVPGIFTPLRRDGRLLVDGGLTNPVPASVARALGAQVVIAVDLNHDIVARKNFQPLAAPLPAMPGQASISRWTESYRQAMLELKARLLARERPGAAQFARWTSTEEPLPNIFEVLLASINVMENRITDSRLALERPELVIQPPLGHIRFLEFGRAPEIIEIGYEAAAKELAAAAPFP